MATFFHTRRFLAYHGDRFKDVSLVLRDEGGRIVGLFPAAVDPADSQRVSSHPGITFGGLLHDGGLYGDTMIESLAALRSHYAESGFQALRYKAVPHIYHLRPAGDDLYALFRAQATRYRCDLSSAIDLTSRGAPSSRRLRGLKKAFKGGVSVHEGAEYIAPLWEVLKQNLQQKHGAKPVHSLEEIVTLHTHFPEHIIFVVARLESEVIAGVVLFLSQRVTHVQYVASGDLGSNLGALDAVFAHCIERSAERGAKYFDFGTSNEHEGQYLNSGLYQFKSEFGGGGVAYESYEVNLKS
jgi:hypothetical protein